MDLVDYFSCLQLSILVLKVSHLWQVGASISWFLLVVFDTTSLVFDSFLAAGRIRHSWLMLYTYCLSPGVSSFFQEPCF